MYRPIRFPAVALGLTVVAAGVIGLRAAPAVAGPYGVNVPPPQQASVVSNNEPQTAVAVLAGGCYWGMEEVFSHVKGVTDVVSGYAGGDKAHANYADSNTGRFGDAESVRITYDPQQISYGQLLRIYFSVAHNPTQVNRQGPDVGVQYRSEIFARTAAQAKIARAYIAQLDAAHVYDQPIATKVSVGKSFFPAEAYMQNYAVQHPHSLYLAINDTPKLAALKKRLPQFYDSQPDAKDRLTDND